MGKAHFIDLPSVEQHHSIIPINFTHARQDTYFSLGGGCFLISLPPEKVGCRLFARQLNMVTLLSALWLQLAQLIRPDTLEIQIF